jgi:D-alanyl-D-alanine carboxypeptidase (penicillin-binding protein 5/6)
MKKTKSKHQVRRYLTVFVVIIILAAGVLDVFVARESRVFSITTSSKPLPLQTHTVLGSLKWPTTGQASFGVDNYGVLSTYGEQTPVPTASIAKIMTALSVLKVKPLAVGEEGPTITISATDVQFYNSYVAEDGSVALVTLGEKINEYQALQAMLLPSANNMADTLATWAFGSISNYSAYANKLATQLGLTHSFFSDASGFSPQTTSNATDLFKLGEDALANPLIAQIVSEPAADVPVAGVVKNVDWLLGQDNIIGIKTGNTDQAGGTFLFAARYVYPGSQSLTIVGSILQAPTLQDALDEAVPLLKSVSAQASVKTLVPAGYIVATYKTAWGSTAEAVTTKPVELAMLPSMKPSISLSTQAVSTNTKANQQIGSVSAKLVDNSVSVPVVLNQKISLPTFYWRLTHPFNI